MRELLRSTTAYRKYAEDAAGGCVAHTTLVLFSDEPLLRPLLKECAKAFFDAKDGDRTDALIEKESYSDCIFYPAAGEKYTADGVGELIDESLLLPLEGAKKLFVLDAFQTATPIVQNKLLKVLEEPPEGVFFLLGATAEHAVLSTVLSRAKKFVCVPFSEERIEAALRRRYGDAKEVSEAAAASGGLYSAAEALLAGGGEFDLAERFLLGEETEKICREMTDKRIRPFLSAVRLCVRDALFFQQNTKGSRQSASCRRIAQSYPAGVLLAAEKFVSDAERDIKFNVNPGQAALALARRIQREKRLWLR